MNRYNYYYKKNVFYFSDDETKYEFRGKLIFTNAYFWNEGFLRLRIYII